MSGSRKLHFELPHKHDLWRNNYSYITSFLPWKADREFDFQENKMTAQAKLRPGDGWKEQQRIISIAEGFGLRLKRALDKKRPHSQEDRTVDPE